MAARQIRSRSESRRSRVRLVTRRPPANCSSYYILLYLSLHVALEDAFYSLWMSAVCLVCITLKIRMRKFDWRWSSDSTAILFVSCYYLLYYLFFMLSINVRLYRCNFVCFYRFNLEKYIKFIILLLSLCWKVFISWTSDSLRAIFKKGRNLVQFADSRRNETLLVKKVQFVSYFYYRYYAFLYNQRVEIWICSWKLCLAKSIQVEKFPDQEILTKI